MNLTEATAVNRLLTALDPGLDQVPGRVADIHQARDAARLLADRAYLALHAGVCGAHIGDSWNLGSDAPAGLAIAVHECDDWHDGGCSTCCRNSGPCVGCESGDPS